MNGNDADLRPDWIRLGLVLVSTLIAVAVLTPILVSLLDAPPRKVAHFVLSIGFLSGLAVTSRASSPPLLQQAGLAGEPHPLVLWVKGFVVGAGSLLAFTLILMACGQRELLTNRSLLQIGGIGLRYLPLAFLIGILEDVTFFGFLYHVLGRRVRAPVLIYALTHFIHIAKQETFTWPTALQGAEALGLMVESLVNVIHRPMELAGLVCVGLVLATLRHRRGSVWLPMGLHGGWYWQRTVGRKWSAHSPGDWDWLIGTNRFYDGLLGWLLILAAGWFLLRPGRSHERPDHDGDGDGQNRKEHPGPDRSA